MLLDYAAPDTLVRIIQPRTATSHVPKPPSIRASPAINKSIQERSSRKPSSYSILGVPHYYVVRCASSLVYNSNDQNNGKIDTTRVAPVHRSSMVRFFNLPLAEESNIHEG